MRIHLRQFFKFWLAILAGLFAFHAMAGGGRSPFGVSVAVDSAAADPRVRVEFMVPPECVLYADRLHFLNTNGDDLTPLAIPDPLLEFDKPSGKDKKVYAQSFSAELKRADLAGDQLVVKFQGCTNGSCFFPEKRFFALGTDGMFAEQTNAPESSTASGSVADLNWTNAVGGFEIIGRQTGYLTPSQFDSFLDRSASGSGVPEDPLARFKDLGMTTTLLLIVLGGFLLNFTPCVLPMIPINLAIIGAGSKARTRTEGFRNGSVYGLGMALAYGGLGLVIVLTGAKFGTLNATVWFNTLVAIVFLVLALGMFDVIHIDLSRFGGAGGMRLNSSQAGVWIRSLAVFGMGGMSALLAGACVAPVVISVMLLSASLYAKGIVAGLSLPFLLGAGMALPWPIAGAGVSFLPKPGRWMNWIKYGFGILIIAFAFYYGHLAVHAYALSPRGRVTSISDAPANVSQPNPTVDANEALVGALEQARAGGKQVFVDFRASWCKNCLAMDETVFNQPEVQARLKNFIIVSYDAEQPNRSPTKALLDHFGVMGLPTCLVLKPIEH